MKVGDKIKFDFAGKKKEGTVQKVFPKTVYLKVDFDKDKQKPLNAKSVRSTAENPQSQKNNF